MNIEEENSSSFLENEETNIEGERPNEAQAQPVEGGQVSKKINYEELKYKAKLFIIKDSKESNITDIENYYKVINNDWIKYGLISLEQSVIFHPLYLYQLFNEKDDKRKFFKLIYNNFDEVISDTIIIFFYNEIIIRLDKSTKKNLPSYGVKLYETLNKINCPIKLYYKYKFDI